MYVDSLRLYRWARALARRRVPVLPSLLGRVSLHLFTSSVPPTAEIGEGTLFGYGGAGVFIHARARLGRSCVVAPFAAIAGRGDVEGAAQVGDYVRIGLGAKILGPVRIGDFSQIGPNAVVVQDVPAGAVAFGNPARVVRHMPDPAAEFERATGLQVRPADRRRARQLARPAAAPAPPGESAAPA